MCHFGKAGSFGEFKKKYPGGALEAAVPRRAAALGVQRLRGGGREGEDARGGVLGGDDDVRRRVRRHHAREDGGVDDEEVVGAVDLCVDVDDGVACAAAVSGAELVGAFFGGRWNVSGGSIGGREEEEEEKKQRRDSPIQWFARRLVYVLGVLLT
ncbi:hypothetical protein ColKHC_07454 [Colletotrichum higginsianum]|nr:hypothetical protein ColKHC_07454 [Colletotrichum higginsianum]